MLNAGYVHVDAGTPQELYVWPYFFALPLDKLDARQRVELFKIVTAGDYDDMKQFGAYIFYRVGITPTGSGRSSSPATELPLWELQRPASVTGADLRRPRRYPHLARGEGFHFEEPK